MHVDDIKGGEGLMSTIGTINCEIAKALVMFSSGRVDDERATEIARKATPIYSELIKTNKVLAHKGLD